MDYIKRDTICNKSCSSYEHAEEIISAILRGTEKQAISFMRWKCGNYRRVANEGGRTALHAAAACGKTSVIEWILKKGDCDALLNAKEIETGYTPLHRSIYHRHLGAAISLIKHGANMDVIDNDRMTPLDHVLRRPIPWSIDYYIPREVHVWGSNQNFNLGFENQKNHSEPNTIAYFTERRISIKQVAMGKFHTIFIANDGRAFSCGLGEGGRLGFKSQQNVTVPKQIRLSSNPNLPSEPAHYACVSEDHSIILTERGSIYTFGRNYHYQLGHDPPPFILFCPKQVQFLMLLVVGVQTSKYHTVAWNKHQLFTWGLNNGQLGHSREIERQIKPKLVAGLRGFVITSVCVSDGVTVFATGHGGIYVYQEYCFRKIFDCFGIRRMEVFEGVLGQDEIKPGDEVGWDKYKTDKYIYNISIVGMDYVMIWQSRTEEKTKCLLNAGGRCVSVADAVLRTNKLLVVTQKGEAFEGVFNFFNNNHPSSSTPAPREIDYLRCTDICLKRVRGVYRATSVFCDPSGCSFSVIQWHPSFLNQMPILKLDHSLNYNLLSLHEEAVEGDLLVDLVFCIRNIRIPAHRFIVESNSAYLAGLINSAEQSLRSCLSQNKNFTEDPSLRFLNVLTVTVEDMHPLILKEILQYVYTGMTDLWNPDYWSAEKDFAYSSYLTGDKDVIQRNTLDSCSVSPTFNIDNISLMSSANENYLENDPVNDIRRMAARLNLQYLAKSVDNLQYDRSQHKIVWKVSSSKSHHERLFPEISFNPDNLSHLHDVVIQCNDGRLINAHKCILMMRSVYFKTIFKGNWHKSSGQRNLTLPFPFETVKLVIAYLYQDKKPFMDIFPDYSLLCQLLIAADYLLLEELKRTCEISLVKHATLGNVVELYELSANMIAPTLSEFTRQLICHNLSAMLDSRALDGVSSEHVENLQMCYGEMYPMVLEHEMDPKTESPDLVLLKSLETYDVSTEEDSTSPILVGRKRRSKIAKTVDQSSSVAQQQPSCSNVESSSRPHSESTSGSDLLVGRKRRSNIAKSVDQSSSVAQQQPSCSNVESSSRSRSESTSGYALLVGRKRRSNIAKSVDQSSSVAQQQPSCSNVESSSRPHSESTSGSDLLVGRKRRSKIAKTVDQSSSVAQQQPSCSNVESSSRPHSESTSGSDLLVGRKRRSNIAKSVDQSSSVAQQQPSCSNVESSSRSRSESTSGYALLVGRKRRSNIAKSVDQSSSVAQQQPSCSNVESSSRPHSESTSGSDCEIIS